jgi:hypothetical protein
MSEDIRIDLRKLPLLPPLHVHSLKFQFISCLWFTGGYVHSMSEWSNYDTMLESRIIINEQEGSQVFVTGAALVEEKVSGGESEWSKEGHLQTSLLELTVKLELGEISPDSG